MPGSIVFFFTQILCSHTSRRYIRMSASPLWVIETEETERARRSGGAFTRSNILELHPMIFLEDINSQDFLLRHKVHFSAAVENMKS